MAKKKVEVSEEEKKAKKAKRMEAIKNRPEGQRCNSKQIDTIELANGNVLNTYGYPVVSKRVHVGVLVTSVLSDAKGNPISTSSTWVPGEYTIKAKKGHGAITGVKEKKVKEDAPTEEPAKKEKSNKKGKKED